MEEHRISRTALAAALARAFHMRLGSARADRRSVGRASGLRGREGRTLGVMLQSRAPASREQLEALGSRDAMLHAARRASVFYGWAWYERGRRRSVEVFDSTSSSALASIASGCASRPLPGGSMSPRSITRVPQAFKLRRIRECGAPLPDSLHFIGADLSQERVDTALARSAFRPDRPTFFSWPGVTACLTREASLTRLRSIAECTATPTELVFTYVDAREFMAERRSGTVEPDRARVAPMGEPLVSGFDPKQLPDDLRAVGLRLVEDLDGEDLRRRYCRDRAGGLSPTPTVRIARAISATP